MDKLVIDGVTYKKAPEIDSGTCEGCDLILYAACYENNLADDCEKGNYIWKKYSHKFAVMVTTPHDLDFNIEIINADTWYEAFIAASGHQTKHLPADALVEYFNYLHDAKEEEKTYESFKARLFQEDLYIDVVEIE